MKKLICSLLTLSLALLALTTSYAQEGTDIDILRASDVNADGMINILDLVVIASHFGETSTVEQPLTSDVNGDGNVNILDLVLVASHLGETVRPPVAFISVEPEIGSELDMNGTITLTFDNSPTDITVNTGTATIDGNSVTITGPFTPGDLELTITWEDGTETLSYTIRPPAVFVSADPESSAVLTPNDSITLTFDNPPTDVTLSTGTATMAGNSVTITGPFAPGDLELTITWADGTETLSYTVRPFVAFVSADPESGVEITTNDSITLTFDNPPADVKVSTGVILSTGNTATITGPFTPGDLELTITWEDGTETFSYTVRSLVGWLSIDPTADSLLTIDSSIIVTFDAPPQDVTVNTGTATIDGNTVTITGPFTPGDLELTITWSDGSLSFTYTIAEPDTESPTITGGTISDSDTDVDAEAINSSTLIEVEFSEEVSGTIALQTEAGDDVGWTGTIEDKKATLELVKGKELDPETTYVIAGKVEDAAGNETDINITFTTASTYDGIPFEVTDETFETLVLESKLPVVVESYKDG